MNWLRTACITGALLTGIGVYSQTNASPSAKTIPLGLQVVKQYITSNIFWVDTENGTEHRYRAIQHNNLKYFSDEDASHAYTVKLRLKSIDDPTLPILECDITINFDYEDKEISELSNNIFGHYCEIY